MISHFTVQRKCTNDQFSVLLFDFLQRKVRDVDKFLWRHNAFFHQVDQVRTTSNDLRCGILCKDTNGSLGRRGFYILKVDHDLPPCDFTSEIALTILGYAPQRQIFPLIYSRISASVFACRSWMQATADMICPGVQ